MDAMEMLLPDVHNWMRRSRCLPRVGLAPPLTRRNKDVQHLSNPQSPVLFYLFFSVHTSTSTEEAVVVPLTILGRWRLPRLGIFPSVRVTYESSLVHGRSPMGAWARNRHQQTTGREELWVKASFVPKPSASVLDGILCSYHLGLVCSDPTS